jgi:hypothetical protein
MIRCAFVAVPVIATVAIDAKPQMPVRVNALERQSP